MRITFGLIAASLCVLLAADALAAATWVRAYTVVESPASGGNLRLGAIEPVANSGYVLTGIVQSATNDDEYARLVMKLDADGNIAWQKVFLGAGAAPTNVYATSDGGYVASGDSPLRILWLSATGEVLRQRTYGEGWGPLLPTADGGYVFGGTTYDPSGRSFPWLTKIDGDGNARWTKRYVGAANVGLASAGPERGFMMAGTTWDSEGNRLVAVLNLDQDGSVIWYREFVFGTNFRLQSIMPTPDGGHLVLGHIVGYLLRTIVVLKLDGDGALLWQTAYQDSEAEAQAVLASSDGGYLLVGSIGFRYSHLSPAAALLLKLDSSGNVMWQRVLSSGTGIEAETVGATPDGGYIVTGSRYKSAWVAKLDAAGHIRGCGNVSDSDLTAVAIESPITVVDRSVSVVQATATATNIEVPATDVLIHAGGFCYPSVPATGVRAIEYFHKGYGHYFITASPEEAAALDSGTVLGWSRTRQVFDAFPLGTASANDVCRFWSGDTFAPKSSHFHSASEAECTAVKQNSDWQFEGEVFAVGTTISGVDCRYGQSPLYRFYNDGRGGAPNHRYTISSDIASMMRFNGWIPEGTDRGVVGCVPRQ